MVLIRKGKFFHWVKTVLTIINFTATIQKVPTTSSYFSSVELQSGHGSQKVFIKFTGVHIPW